MNKLKVDYPRMQELIKDNALQAEQLSSLKKKYDTYVKDASTISGLKDKQVKLLSSKLKTATKQLVKQDSQIQEMQTILTQTTAQFNKKSQRLEKDTAKAKRELNENGITWKRKLNTLRDENAEDVMNLKIEYEKKVSALKVDNVNMNEFLTQIK